jgi:hypothetical protein
MPPSPTTKQIWTFIEKGIKLKLATDITYPSRGQTATQELYVTEIGRFFLKRTTVQNNKNCRINMINGSLAEREFWAFCLAKELGLLVPELWLLDEHTTVQRWLDYPDASQCKNRQIALRFGLANVFDCALFDWLTGQIDRHDANYLYDYEKIILIDSAHSFLKYSGSLPDYLYLFQIQQKEKLRLKINSNHVHRRMIKLSVTSLRKIVPLRESEEQQALEHRLKKIKTVDCLQDIIDLYKESKK